MKQESETCLLENWVQNFSLASLSRLSFVSFRRRRPCCSSILVDRRQLTAAPSSAATGKAGWGSVFRIISGLVFLLFRCCSRWILVVLTVAVGARGGETDQQKEKKTNKSTYFEIFISSFVWVWPREEQSFMLSFSPFFLCVRAILTEKGGKLLCQ